jgi:trans-2,3-dihydro-3-hydroxyanthranilate isomerase
VPRSYSFAQVDVFTDRIFGGNSLAVFLEPDGLSDAEMQSIALEMNLAETTFVFPATRSDCAARVRIFTPSRELPFAGHPTVGTAWVLARTRRLPASAREIQLEEGIGAVPVTFEGDPSNPTTVWMTHRDPEFGPELTQRGPLAAALGLAESDLLDGAPIRTGSTGVAFVYVPLVSASAVDRVEPNSRALRDVYQGDLIGIFVFAPDAERGPGRVYSRMFAVNAPGAPEDPATGSASGPLGAYVAERGLVELQDPIELVSLQGARMGRPSTIRIRLRLEDGRARDIRVGGGVVPVLEGVLTLPS